MSDILKLLETDPSLWESDPDVIEPIYALASGERKELRWLGDTDEQRRWRGWMKLICKKCEIVKNEKLDSSIKIQASRELYDQLKILQLVWDILFKQADNHKEHEGICVSYEKTKIRAHALLCRIICDDCHGIILHSIHDHLARQLKEGLQDPEAKQDTNPELYRLRGDCWNWDDWHKALAEEEKSTAAAHHAQKRHRQTLGNILQRAAADLETSDAPLVITAAQLRPRPIEKGVPYEETWVSYAKLVNDRRWYQLGMHLVYVSELLANGLSHAEYRESLRDLPQIDVAKIHMTREAVTLVRDIFFDNLQWVGKDDLAMPSLLSTPYAMSQRVHKGLGDGSHSGGSGATSSQNQKRPFTTLSWSSYIKPPCPVPVRQVPFLPARAPGRSLYAAHNTALRLCRLLKR